jgi:hypothetical protein
MPVKAVYCKESELALAISTLRAEADERIARAGKLPGDAQDNDLKQEAYRSADRLFDAARSLEESLNYSHESPTLDEERESILNLIRDTGKQENGYTYSGTLRDQLAYLIRSLREDKDRTIGLLATLVDEQRVKLEAMRWILKSALGSPTHKSKDSRLNLALEATDQILSEVQGIDPETLPYYTSWDWHKGSWNTRRLNADLRRKEDVIRHLQERLEAVENEHKADDAVTGVE